LTSVNDDPVFVASVSHCLHDRVSECVWSATAC
jgi:hypothetical protein